MDQATGFLLIHGYTFLFLWVLLEQAGLPLPSSPLLIAAGALSVTRGYSLVFTWVIVVAASLLSDTSWYFLGRKYGGFMVRLMCRLSLEASSCVRRTEETLGRRGSLALVFAKFVPGLGAVTAPIAGQIGMKLRTFLFFDLIGSLLWVVSFTLAGRFFTDIIRRNQALAGTLGRLATGLVVSAILFMFALRIFQRRSFLRQVQMDRLEPDELKALMDRGDPLYLVDLRHPLEAVNDPFTLPGAIRMDPEDLKHSLITIPHGREVVLFCSCPSEATAAHTALALHRLGVSRVRPLKGGYDGWKALGYPLQAIKVVD